MHYAYFGLLSGCLYNGMGVRGMTWLVKDMATYSPTIITLITLTSIVAEPTHLLH